MRKNAWLVVANSSMAHIYKIETKKKLVEVKTMDHPESRLHNLDLVSDKPGRDFESLGFGRHALEVKVTPKHQEFILFAKEVADYLEAARQQGQFHDLYIAASPSLLGLLRQALSPGTMKLIQGEVDKDMTHMKPAEIMTHLPFI
jgi:protein required for attachment to host cells